MRAIPPSFVLFLSPLPTPPPQISRDCFTFLFSSAHKIQNLLLSFSCNQLTPVMFLKPNTQHYKTLVLVHCHSRTRTENQSLLNLSLCVSNGSLYLAKTYGEKEKIKKSIPSHEQWHSNSLSE